MPNINPSTPLRDHPSTPPTDSSGAETQTDAERQEPTPYHNAAFNVFCYRLHKYKENDDVTLSDEHRLSKEPLRIDIVVIKKNRDIELELVWAKIFRTHNLVEYKSPVDKPPTLAVFDKLIGYARIYAAQEEVKISDMTATIICANPPEKLFEILKKDFDYEILQKDDGIYYIIQKGVAVEKNLAIQVVTEKSELLLQALDKTMLDEATVDKVTDFMFTDGKDNKELLGCWFDVMMSENFQNILKGGGNDMNMEKRKKFVELLESVGLSDDIQQKGLQKGLQKGRQEGALEVIALLEKGYSLTDAKKKLQLT
jgi:hypothetical protein